MKSIKDKNLIPGKVDESRKSVALEYSNQQVAKDLKGVFAAFKMPLADQEALLRANDSAAKK